MRDDRPIFLGGFMGAGKSTVGAIVAERLRWRFVDTDREIESRSGEPIGELFRRGGETAFRDLEKQVIADLKIGMRTVVALGGGALIDADTRGGLRNLGRVVHLSARVETILGRLDATTRPLLAAPDAATREAKVRALIEARTPSYREAELEVATDDRTADEVAGLVLAALRGAEGT